VLLAAGVWLLEVWISARSSRALRTGRAAIRIAGAAAPGARVSHREDEPAAQDLDRHLESGRLRTSAAGSAAGACASTAS
jgi:hypothetical protein